MARLRRCYEGSHLHYITCSTYRRTRAFEAERFKFGFVDVLRELRLELEFKLVGYVLMPEHFHMLIGPFAQVDPSRIMQSFKMNICSERKHLEKLDYRHANPVKRGWVEKARDWPWSSWLSVPESRTPRMIGVCATPPAPWQLAVGMQ